MSDSHFKFITEYCKVDARKREFLLNFYLMDSGTKVEETSSLLIDMNLMYYNNMNNTICSICPAAAEFLKI